MSQNTKSAIYLGALAGVMSITWASPAVAQEGKDSVENGEIIVTARKREETAIDVPVAITALGGEDLKRYATSDFSGIANQVPGMMVVAIPGGGGGTIALRGVSSSMTNPAIDQAVALNVDGVQLGSANFLRLSQIDLQQIEVLKGPQALFFGKNSPGGVISIRTADPKDHFEGSVQLGYEFEGREKTLQAMVSGPIAENLKGRLVFYGVRASGYNKNTMTAAVVDPVGGFDTYAPTLKRGPKNREEFVRATLLFDPSSAFTARLKYSYSHRKGTSPYVNQQRINCPYGAPQTRGFPTTAECKADSHFTNGGVNPALIDALSHSPNDWMAGEDHDRGRTVQHLASLEMNLELAPHVNLTNVSSFFQVDDEFIGSATYQDTAYLWAGTFVNRRELGNELRIVTDNPDWPVNLSMGGFIQDVKFRQEVPLGFDAYWRGLSPTPNTLFLGTDNKFRSDGSTVSAFGQARWNIIKGLELAGGVRYTHEKKSLKIHTASLGDVVPAVDQITFSNWSPEATLTYKINSGMSLFAAYRTGYKSGGFNTGGGAYSPGQKVDYLPEKVKGFEGGFKYATGPLRFNITAYNYKYTNMQISTFDPSTTTQTVINAQGARVKGIEADITYRTPLDGLTLRGSVNRNKARFLEFQPGCYQGQTIAQGCNINPGPTGVFRQQDLTGRQLILAPDWSGNAGFTFEQPIGSGLRVTLTGDANFSSGFWGMVEQAPLGRQKNYTMFDAGLKLGDEDDRWEVALMGRNLSNVYRARFVSQASFTGNGAATGTATTGGLADYTGIVNRGREVRIQLKYNFR